MENLCKKYLFFGNPDVRLVWFSLLPSFRPSSLLLTLKPIVTVCVQLRIRKQLYRRLIFAQNCALTNETISRLRGNDGSRIEEGEEELARRRKQR
jgi:hypothetical protein